MGSRPENFDFSSCMTSKAIVSLIDSGSFLPGIYMCLNLHIHELGFFLLQNQQTYAIIGGPQRPLPLLTGLESGIKFLYLS